MKYSRFLLLFLVLSDACIDRYDLPEQISAPRLVINGLLTDQDGPQTIEIYKSVDMNTNLNTPVIISNADVRIVDDLGNETELTEVADGIYQTTAFHGVVGRTYHAIVKVGENIYQSRPQMMNPAGEITDVQYTFVENAINQNDPGEPQDVMDVYIEARGVENEKNLFRWRWSSTYEVKTYPEKRTIWAGKPPVEYPAPLACSGFTVQANTLTKVNVCTCCSCWISDQSEKVLISQNATMASNEFSSVFIARVPVDHWRFNLRYFMKIQQLSLSEEVYTFWKLVKSQQDGEGSLFQPNSVKVKGNFTSTTNPAEEVLGIFAVSAVAEKEIFIDRKEISPDIELKNDTIKGSCVGAFVNASNKKPLYW